MSISDSIHPFIALADFDIVFETPDTFDQIYIKFSCPCQKGRRVLGVTVLIRLLDTFFPCQNNHRNLDFWDCFVKTYLLATMTHN